MLQPEVVVRNFSDENTRSFWLNLRNISIFCDKTSAINLPKSPSNVHGTKHINTRHLFLRDHV